MKDFFEGLFKLFLILVALIFGYVIGTGFFILILTLWHSF